jgi:hypothetical protein
MPSAFCIPAPPLDYRKPLVPHDPAIAKQQLSEWPNERHEAGLCAFTQCGTNVKNNRQGEMHRFGSQEYWTSAGDMTSVCRLKASLHIEDWLVGRRERV